MIRIDLKLFVTLARYHPSAKGGSGPHEVVSGTTVERLIKDLGIPPDTVKLIFVNGKKVPVSAVLEDGDRLGLFPPVGGG